MTEKSCGELLGQSYYRYSARVSDPPYRLRQRHCLGVEFMVPLQPQVGGTMAKEKHVTIQSLGVEKRDTFLLNPSAQEKHALYWYLGGEC